MIPEAKKGPDVVVTYAGKGRGPRRDGDERDGARRPRRPPKRPTARRDKDAAPTRTPVTRSPRNDRPARESHG